MNTLKLTALAILASAAFGAPAQANPTLIQVRALHGPRVSENLIRPTAIAGFGQVMIMNMNRVSLSVTYQVTVLNADLSTTVTTNTASVGPFCNYTDSSFSGQNITFATISDYHAE
jgi:hypothetical protein